MKAIISAVLWQEEAVGHTLFAYIDNLYVNNDVMPATRVREHPTKFGLGRWRTSAGVGSCDGTQ